MFLLLGCIYEVFILSFCKDEEEEGEESDSEEDGHDQGSVCAVECVEMRCTTVKLLIICDLNS